MNIMRVLVTMHHVHTFKPFTTIFLYSSSFSLLASPLCPFTPFLHTVMSTLEKQKQISHISVLSRKTKPSAMGWTRMKWGKVCRGGENVPFVTPYPIRSISPYPAPNTPTPPHNTHPATGSPTLKGTARVGGRG